MFGSGASLVGLDVGASSIKVVSGKKTKSGVAIENLALMPLPTRSIDERGIINREEVVRALSTALSGIGKKSPKVATAVRGMGVLTKRVTIPKVPRKEIPDQIRWEAEQVFPTDVTTILTDYLLLGEGAEVPGAPAGTTGWDVLLIGVRSDDAGSLNEVISASQAQVKVMDLDAFVVSDLLNSLFDYPSNEAVAYVDVGAATTRFTVCHQGRVIFIREFVTAGNAFTDAIAQTLGLSFEDAEAIKIQGESSGIPQAASDALSMVLGTWKNELQQSEDIFVTQEGSAQLHIGRYLVFGGGSLTPGLTNVLQEERFANRVAAIPYEQILKASSKKIDPALLLAWGPRLLTAAGLSLRAG